MHEVDKEYCSYAHEGNCTKELVWYNEYEKLKDILEEVIKICTFNGAISYESLTSGRPLTERGELAKEILEWVYKSKEKE